MKHVFVSPHPDDIALSCGGLIARLRDVGEEVAIATVFCRAGARPRLTRYQLRALGFDPEADARDEPEPTDPADANADAPDSAPTPEEVMAVRRAEDEAYARFAGASIAFVNMPDGVFRGYVGGPELMAAPRADDPSPVEELRAVLAGLRPDRVYIPLSIGGHVDHRQTRRAGITLLAEARSPYLDRATFFEDFPYAMKVGFERLDQLDPEILSSLPAGVSLTPEYVEIEDLLDRKIEGLRAYDSQIGHLFRDEDESVTGTIRAYTTQVGRLGGVGPAERYWRVTSNGHSAE
jgi:LmbE family N-acetylglucosaminyl deacetylase